MCIPIGLEFRCSCDWTAWLPCNDAACDIQRLFEGGVPPAANIGKLETAGAARSRAATYVKWAHGTFTFIKFDSCCGSGCCNDDLADHAKGIKLARYREAVKLHLENCLPMFLYGPVLLNSMRSAEVEFTDLEIDHTKLAAYRNEFANGLKLLDIYKEAVEKNYLSRKLNVDRIERTPMLQYLYFRRAALQNPERCPTTWKPTKQLVNMFQASHGRLDQPVMADAQVGFENIDAKQVEGHLRLIVDSQKAARACESPEEDAKDETAMVPLPMGASANPGAAQNITCENAIQRYNKLYRWVNEMPDLPANFATSHDKADAVRLRTADLTKARDRSNAIYNRTLNEDHAAYLTRSSVEGVIEAKINNLKSVSRSVKIPTPPGSTQASTKTLGTGQAGYQFSQQYAPTNAPVPALVGDYPPQPSWDTVPGIATAPAPPARQPTQFQWLSKAEAETEYAQILHELRGLGRLSLSFFTPQQQRQAIENRKRDLLSADDRCMRTFTRVDWEDQYTQAIREQVEATIQNLRKDVKTNEERLLAAVPAAAPPGPAYGPPPGVPPAPMHPPRQHTFPSVGGQASGSRQGGGYGGENPYPSGYGPSSTTRRSGTSNSGRGGSQEDVGGVGGSSKGPSKPSTKTGMPPPPSTITPASLPARPKPAHLQPKGPGSSTHASAQGSVASLNSAISQSTAGSKLPGDSQPVSSLPGKKRSNQAPSIGYNSESADSNNSKSSAKDKGKKDEDGLMKRMFKKSPFKSPFKDKKKK